MRSSCDGEPRNRDCKTARAVSILGIASDHFFRLKQDPGFEIADEGVAQAGVPEAGDVIGGLARPVDLVLKDQVLGQLEGQVEEGLA